MIDELLSAVREGQPRSVVVGHNMKYAQSLLDRVARELTHYRIPFEVRPSTHTINADGSEIRFIGVTNHRLLDGMGRVGYFVDHAVYEFYKARTQGGATYDQYVEHLDDLIDRERLWYGEKTDS